MTAMFNVDRIRLQSQLATVIACLV